MRSDIIKVNSSGTGMDEALAQAELVARYKGLTEKQGLWLRLLAEEMMGMLRGLTGEDDASFWIEDEGGEFRLHLSTQTAMDREKRKKLLDASTSGSNAAAKGIMSKLRCLIETAFEPDAPGAIRYLDPGWMCAEDDLTGLSNTYWSLNNYREYMESRRDTEEWDELECSIVGNLADEVKVGIKGGKVEMTIYKTIKKED